MVVEGPVVTGRLMTFRVGPGRFAVLLDDVLGVQDPAEIAADPAGGVVFQGRSLVAVDARRLWWSGSGPPATMTSPAAIFVSSGREATALIVDRVEGIVDGVEMLPLPALVETFVKNVFRGVTLHADGERLVVDPATLPGAVAVAGQGGSGEA
jgi:chemotaxis protein histidine kinase CheA